jgi:hypothetical protein
MKIVYCTSLLIILSCCGPSANLRRAERLIKKAELNGASWRQDTIKVTMPVFVDRIALDTLFISRPSDTITIEKSRLKLKYVRLPGDTVWIEAVCDSTVIYKEVPVTITKVISAPKSNWWRALLIGVGIGAFLVLFGLYVLRR